ncbi:MAG: mechanosensitive ion channel [Clostridia bacterium]|nr:mechanosensitive ion channel [Clostridia bacterium]
MNFEQFLTTLAELGVTLGGKIIAALLILGIGLKLSGFLVKLIVKSRPFEKIDITAQTFLKSIIAISLKAIVFVTAIGVLGVPLTSVITVVASCGVAVGLALQGGLSNLAGGIIIIILKPFKVGDYIVEGGVEGTVEAIGIFYTTLLTPDNKRVIIPNGGLMNSTVTAVNQLDTRRVDFKFSVSYSSDIDKVRKVIAYVIENTENIIADRGVDIFLSNHGESSIDFSVRVWTQTENYWKVYFSVNENVKKAFDKANIEIPFPQMDVHVKNN